MKKSNLLKGFVLAMTASLVLAGCGSNNSNNEYQARHRTGIRSCIVCAGIFGCCCGRGYGQGRNPSFLERHDVHQRSNG